MEETYGVKLTADVDQFISRTDRATGAMAALGNQIKQVALDPMQDFITRQRRLEDGLGKVGNSIDWFNRRIGTFFAAQTVAGFAAARSASNYEKSLGAVSLMSSRTGRDMNLVTKAIKDQSTGLASRQITTAAMQELMQTKLSVESMGKVLQIAKDAATLKPWVPLEHQLQQISAGIRQLNGNLIDNFVEIGRLDQVYNKYARSVNKSVNALTVQEKQEAIVNAMMTTGAALMGQHEQAMKKGSLAADVWKKNISEIALEMGKRALPEYKMFNNAMVSITGVMRTSIDKADALRESYKRLGDEWEDLVGFSPAKMIGGASGKIFDMIFAPLEKLKQLTRSKSVGDMMENFAGEVAAPLVNLGITLTKAGAYINAGMTVVGMAFSGGVKVLGAAAFLGMAKEMTGWTKMFARSIMHEAPKAMNSGGVKAAISTVGKTAMSMMSESFREETLAMEKGSKLFKNIGDIYGSSLEAAAKSIADKENTVLTKQLSSAGRVIEEGMLHAVDDKAIVEAAKKEVRVWPAVVEALVGKTKLGALTEGSKRLMNGIRLTRIGLTTEISTLNAAGKAVSIGRAGQTAQAFRNVFTGLRESGAGMKDIFSKAIRGATPEAERAGLELGKATGNLAFGTKGIFSGLGMMKAGFTSAMKFLSPIMWMEMAYSGTKAATEIHKSWVDAGYAVEDYLSAVDRSTESVGRMARYQREISKLNKDDVNYYENVNKLREKSIQQMVSVSKSGLLGTKEKESLDDAIEKMDELNTLTKSARFYGKDGAGKAYSGAVSKAPGAVETVSYELGEGMALYKAQALEGRRARAKAVGEQLSTYQYQLSQMKESIVARPNIKGREALIGLTDTELAGQKGIQTIENMPGLSKSDKEMWKDLANSYNALAPAAQKMGAALKPGNVNVEVISNFTRLVELYGEAAKHQDEYVRSIEAAGQAYRNARTHTADMSRQMDQIFNPKSGMERRNEAIQGRMANIADITKAGGIQNVHQAQQIQQAVQEIVGIDQSGSIRRGNPEMAEYLKQANELAGKMIQEQAKKTEDNDRRQGASAFYRREAYDKQIGDASNMAKALLAAGKISESEFGQMRDMIEKVNQQRSVMELQGAPEAAQGQINATMKQIGDIVGKYVEGGPERAKELTKQGEIAQAGAGVFGGDRSLMEVLIAYQGGDEKTKASLTGQGGKLRDWSESGALPEILKTFAGDMYRWETRSSGKSSEDKASLWKEFAPEGRANYLAKTGQDIASSVTSTDAKIEQHTQDMVDLLKLLVQAQKETQSNVLSAPLQKGIDEALRVGEGATGGTVGQRSRAAMEVEKDYQENASGWKYINKETLEEFKERRSKGLASGGAVSPTSTITDSIPAWLSGDEFVISAQAMRKPGARQLAHALNYSGSDGIKRATSSYARFNRFAEGTPADVTAGELAKQIESVLRQSISSEMSISQTTNAAMLDTSDSVTLDVPSMVRNTTNIRELVQRVVGSIIQNSGMANDINGGPLTQSIMQIIQENYSSLIGNRSMMNKVLSYAQSASGIPGVGQAISATAQVAEAAFGGIPTNVNDMNIYQLIDKFGDTTFMDKLFNNATIEVQGMIEKAIKDKADKATKAGIAKPKEPGLDLPKDYKSSVPAGYEFGQFSQGINAPKGMGYEVWNEINGMIGPAVKEAYEIYMAKSGIPDEGIHPDVKGMLQGIFQYTAMASVWSRVGRTPTADQLLDAANATERDVLGLNKKVDSRYGKTIEGALGGGLSWGGKEGVSAFQYGGKGKEVKIEGGLPAGFTNDFVSQQNAEEAAIAMERFVDAVNGLGGQYGSNDNANEAYRDVLNTIYRASKNETGKQGEYSIPQEIMDRFKEAIKSFEVDSGDLTSTSGVGGSTWLMSKKDLASADKKALDDANNGVRGMSLRSFADGGPVIGSDGALSRNQLALLHAGEIVLDKNNVAGLRKMGFLPFESGTIDAGFDKLAEIVSGVISSFDSLNKSIDTMVNKFSNFASDALIPSPAFAGGDMNVSVPTDNGGDNVLIGVLERFTNSIEALNAQAIAGAISQALQGVTIKADIDDININIPPIQVNLDVKGEITGDGSLVTRIEASNINQLAAMAGTGV